MNATVIGTGSEQSGLATGLELFRQESGNMVRYGGKNACACLGAIATEPVLIVRYTLQMESTLKSYLTHFDF